jgi:hypothetical protein
LSRYFLDAYNAAHNLFKCLICPYNITNKLI